jgi:aspartyl-tRNA(Asn)/glutamyl-tRNA(Gln) amidotransferase subunit A
VTGLDLLTIAGARRALDTGELSALELAEATLERIERLDGGLNAYLHLEPGAVLDQARAADRRAAADRGPLDGIPLCIKDVFHVAGVPTTAGAAGWVRQPTRDAAAVARVRAAGAVMVGKGNTNEFAYGIDGLNPHHGDGRNPHDPARVSGGSSSGPAIATAAGMALGALGTDTTGSIRAPASLCGLVGIRPTLGRVPRTGVIPLAWSYDVAGPLARTVQDAAILLGVLAGHDPDDPVSSTAPVPAFDPGPEPSVHGLTLGLIEDLLEVADPPVADGVRAAAQRLADAGAEVTPLRFGLLHHAEAIHRLIQMAEASQIHAPWFEEQRDRYAAGVRDRLEAGYLVPATRYLQAQQARRRLIEQVTEGMDGVDALLAPSTAVVAPPRDASEVLVGGELQGLRPALLSCVLPLSQFGWPVLSVPAGLHDGLPYGLQIMGRAFAEPLVLRIGAVAEQALPWPERRPPLD